MKTENIVLWVILVLVIGIFVFAFSGFFKNDSMISSETKGDIRNAGNSDAGFKSISSGSTDSGDVSIELTPTEVNNGKLKVQISANTHSGDLSQFNLKQITILEYSGKFAKPLSAPILDGHHSSGELIFDVEEDLTSFTIKIKGIPKVEERIFEWG